MYSCRRIISHARSFTRREKRIGIVASKMTKERWLHGFRRIGETVSKMKISPGRDRNREGETSDGEKYGTSGQNNGTNNYANSRRTIRSKKRRRSTHSYIPRLANLISKEIYGESPTKNQVANNLIATIQICSSIRFYDIYDISFLNYLFLY